jgi:hypothetical protein
MKVRFRTLLAWLALIMLVAACAAQPSPQQSSATPDSGNDVEPTAAHAVEPTSIMEGLETADVATQRMVDALSANRLPTTWAPQGAPELYGAEELYDLVNGQADAYFVYAFEKAAVRTFENASGDTLRVEIWRTATSDDAYGLYSGQRSGVPVDVGVEGDADSGRRLGFWQDRYNVRLFAFQPVPDEELVAFAKVLASELPFGGERPELVGILPLDGLEERSVLFFHEQLTLQNYLWLDGENLLGLGPTTDGVLASYQMDDAMLQLLVVRYPDSGASRAGLEALQSMPPDDLLVADSSGDLLGAVIGSGDETAARELLAAVLRN